MQLDYNLTFFFLLLPFVSFLYSSVGHGGASGYLALMALFSFPTELMKQTALVLNLFVAGITFYQYYRGGHFNKNLFIYFALGSIPTSYFGGLWSIDPVLYKKILGFLLIFAIARILFSKNKNADELKLIRPVIALLIGATIGFFSGLIGIGGGIILSPVILLLHWGKMKETAAVSALFIWVNSFSGLLGQWTSGLNLSSSSAFMIVLALLGGALGSYVGSSKWNNKRLEYLLALVLTTAAIKLILF
jgi:uncharacterized membrane protein YfcA